MVPVPENLNKESFKQGLVAALKRFSSGFLKTIGLVAPVSQRNPYLPQMPQGPSFQMIQEKLQEGHNIRNLDLSKGTVPEDIDLLLLLAPGSFSDKHSFAVDQFLMKGGTVILSTAPFHVQRTQNSLDLSVQDSGIKSWLKGLGVEFEEKLVMDPQNESYPVPVRRQVMGLTVEEIQSYPYPPFVDVRGEGLNPASGIVAGLPQVTLNWASPLIVDREKNKTRKVTELMYSSNESWTTGDRNVLPDYEAFREYGFPAGGDRKRELLGVLIEGEFESAFKGQESPLAAKEEKDPKADDDDSKEKKEEPLTITGVIEKSPESARLLVISSNEFLADQTMQISSLGSNTRYLNSLQLMENAVDWSLEDRALLSIRSRGHFSRTMVQMSEAKKRFYEYSNYVLMLLGLILVYGVYRIRRAKQQRYYRALLGA